MAKITCPHDKRSALRRAVHDAADTLATAIDDWDQEQIERAYEALDGASHLALDVVRGDGWRYGILLKHPHVEIAYTEYACEIHRENGEHS